MPNPNQNVIITRCQSEPNISKTKPTSIPPSNRSTCSTTAAKTKTRRKGGRSRNRKHGSENELTEASLEEFNRRTAINDKKNSNSSPYYKGLTDSTLYISRQKLAGSSPGRESIYTAETSSSKSSMFVRIQTWGTSCFKGKSSPLRSSSMEINDAKETNTLSNEEKPLRERVEEVVAVQPQTRRTVAVKEEEKPEVVTPPPTQPPPSSSVTTTMTKRNNKEREFVWANKYRPKALKDFICNRDKAEQLHDLVKEGHCNHYIFEGFPGVGKRTMVWAMLREAFGPEKLMTRKECMEFELKGEAVPSIKVNVQVSSQHVEINLSELHGHEKHVIGALIKETQSMALNDAMYCDYTNCRAIVLYEADKLSTDAQLYIRWLMERNKGCNRIFFCCHDVSKLHPIKSLCTVIRLLPPSNEEIVEVLEFIAKQEGIQLPLKLAERIAENSKRNLRQAIRSFEASWQLNYPFREDQVIMTGWEEDIANIAKNIIEEQSPKQLYIIRGKLQNLIEHNVSHEFIFSTLLKELKKHLSEECLPKIDALYLEYNRDNGCVFDGEKSLVLLGNRHEESMGKRNNDQRKNVQHFLRIEEFTAKFMSFYKYHIMNKIGKPNGHAG